MEWLYSTLIIITPILTDCHETKQNKTVGVVRHPDKQTDRQAKSLKIAFSACALFVYLLLFFCRRIFEVHKLPFYSFIVSIDTDLLMK